MSLLENGPKVPAAVAASTDAAVAASTDAVPAAVPAATAADTFDLDRAQGGQLVPGRGTTRFQYCYIGTG